MHISCLRSASLAVLAVCFSHLAPAQTRAAGALQADRITAAADFNSRVPLPGHLPRWQTAAADRGMLPDAQLVPLNFGLARSPEVQAAFDQLLLDLQNPSSPRYHQWLTPAQVGEQYGPTQHDLDQFTAWLTGRGFTVQSIAPSRIFVQASAPAAVISAALGTSLHRYGLTTGGRAETLQAPANEPTLPAALSGLVSSIGGLTDVPLHTFSHLTALSAPAVPYSGVAGAPASVRPDLTTSGGNHYLTPLDFNKIYNVTASGMTGAGQKIMIIGGSRLYGPDLSNWESLTAQNSYTPNYIVGPQFTDPGTTNDDNMGEGTLDFERAYGTAPGAAIDMVIAQGWLNGTTNANLVQYAISTVNDPILSLSFGACENQQTPAYVRQEDAVYAVAESQGISVLVASGDAGVAGCEAHGVAPPASQIASINDICATSHVTCVGATQFNDTANPSTYWSSSNATGYFSALGYIPEGGWNEPANAGSNATAVPFVVAASGGGPSTVISKPSFQTGAGVPADGARDTPDISFSGSGHDGYFACLNYTGGSCVTTSAGNIPFVAFAGTSASAPSMAGIAALIDQKLGSRQGNLNPALYRTFAATPAAFHDATIVSSGVSACSTATPSPCNNSDPAPNSLTGGIAGYSLQTGYDLVTGLGSLDVTAYLTAVSSAAVSLGSVTLTPASATLSTPAGTPVTDLITLTDVSFSGTENLTCAVNFNGGTAVNAPVCSVSPGSLALTGSGSATFTLSLSSVKGSVKGGTFAQGGELNLGGLGGIALCGLVGLFIPWQTRRSVRRVRIFAAMLVLLSGLGAITGCGGGSNFSSGTPIVSRTSAGSYDVTVNANSNLNQGNNVGYSTTIRLTIQ